MANADPPALNEDSKGVREFWVPLATTNFLSSDLQSGTRENETMRNKSPVMSMNGKDRLPNERWQFHGRMKETPPPSTVWSNLRGLVNAKQKKKEKTKEKNKGKNKEKNNEKKKRKSKGKNKRKNKGKNKGKKKRTTKKGKQKKEKMKEKTKEKKKRKEEGKDKGKKNTTKQRSRASIWKNSRVRFTCKGFCHVWALHPHVQGSRVRFSWHAWHSVGRASNYSDRVRFFCARVRFSLLVWAFWRVWETHV